MNARIALLLCACSTACAELPPVVGSTGGVTPNPAVNAPNPPASLTTTYEMMKRIEQMQAEVQQLTGKVEEQVSQIEDLKKQQKTMYTDFDDRLQSIENKSGTGGSPLAETPPDASVPAESGSTETESSAPAISDQPVPQGQSEGNPSDAIGNTAETPVPNPAQASSTSSAASSAQVPEAEKQEYQQGYDDLRNGRTSQAITEFNAYIANHPGSAYAGNAQYWLGEAHRVNLDNASARKAFSAVVETYPNSAKVPDALLKLGYIEMEEKNSAKAREYLMQVTTGFSGSKAARLAEKKLLILDGSGP
ncbi:tol-pal system protein YbgF [Methyloglobulus sp.]|uniref:tol-pal system protein YbgF n=1 Tax=Methyloglobulus sp. TaxID=2518622 RepID=UPI003989F624